MEEDRKRNALLECLGGVCKKVRDLMAPDPLVLRSVRETEAIRARIERTKAFPAEQEVLKIIFNKYPELQADDLKMMCKECDAAGVVLLELHHGPEPEIVFIYVNERYRYQPSFTKQVGIAKRQKVSFDHPGASVLYRIGTSRKLKEIHRWDNQE